ncbi:MAG: SDR family oxidoreductase [Phycisphaerae bacterium]
MRILVTGSQGYIGRILVRRLVAAGHHVVGLDAGWYARPGDTNDTAVIRADVRDLPARRLADFDAVAHFAALSNDPLGELDPELTLEINCEATLTLAEKAREAGVSRFLFSSSCSIYGRSDADAVDETAPVEPLTAYARSKVIAERGLVELASADFVPVILRNATAYGVSPAQRFDLVVPNLVAAALTQGRIALLSDGAAWRPLVHIQDIAAACLALLGAPADAVRGEAFNVGRDDDNHRVSDIAELIHTALPECPISFAPGGGEPDARSYRVSFGKIRRLVPTFQPRWTLPRGIAECVAEFRALELTRASLAESPGNRVKSLRALLDGGRLDSSLRWAAAPVAAI